ncbi:hypothetical protein CMT78_03850 [Elizabethkingia anophelis]|nr:hypothetical protein [Elizabethkingia anophelis]
MGNNNIFISHHGKDDHHVQNLKTRLKSKGFGVKNFSIDSTKHHNGRRPSDARIRRLLKIRIKAASTFICLIGKETHKRKWVDYEIRRAQQEGKKIIGIYTHGNKNEVSTPLALQQYANSILGWNSIDKLGEIITGKTTVFENADGSSYSNVYSISRVKCK